MCLNPQKDFSNVSSTKPRIRGISGQPDSRVLQRWQQREREIPERGRLVLFVGIARFESNSVILSGNVPLQLPPKVRTGGRQIYSDVRNKNTRRQFASQKDSHWRAIVLASGLEASPVPDRHRLANSPSFQSRAIIRSSATFAVIAVMFTYPARPYSAGTYCPSCILIGYSSGVPIPSCGECALGLFSDQRNCQTSGPPKRALIVRLPCCIVILQTRSSGAGKMLFDRGRSGIS